MSLIYTSTRSRKKQKRKPGWKQREEEHRKHLKKLGIDPDSKPKKREFVAYKPEENPYRRVTPDIPSHGDGIGNGLRKETNTYTGTLIKGIATMHKSNAVPVINDQQAKDIANMRRN